MRRPSFSMSEIINLAKAMGCTKSTCTLASKIWHTNGVTYLTDGFNIIKFRAIPNIQHPGVHPSGDIHFSCNIENGDVSFEKPPVDFEKLIKDFFSDHVAGRFLVERALEFTDDIDFALNKQWIESVRFEYEGVGLFNLDIH